MIKVRHWWRFSVIVCPCHFWDGIDYWMWWMKYRLCLYWMDAVCCWSLYWCDVLQFCSTVDGTEDFTFRTNMWIWFLPSGSSLLNAWVDDSFVLFDVWTRELTVGSPLMVFTNDVVVGLKLFGPPFFMFRTGKCWIYVPIFFFFFFHVARGCDDVASRIAWDLKL